MRTLDLSINPALPATGTYVSPGFTLDHMEGLSVQFSTTSGSSAVGAIKLQCSNNGFLDNQGVYGQQPDPNAVWSDISGSTNAIASGANSFMYNVSAVYYRWARLVYTASSGTATSAQCLLVAHGKGTQS